MQKKKNSPFLPKYKLNNSAGRFRFSLRTSDKLPNIRHKEYFHSTVPTAVLQTGQELCSPSHLSMQDSWNLCQQGRVFTELRTPMASRQMLQLPSRADPCVDGSWETCALDAGAGPPLRSC